MPSLISGAQREMEFRNSYKEVIANHGKDSKEYNTMLKKYNAEVDYYPKIKKHEVYLPSMKIPDSRTNTQSVMFFLEDKSCGWGSGWYER